MPERAGSLLSSIGVIWLAATLAFFALRVLPGDAIETQLLDSGAGTDVIAERRAEQGLADPLWTQYTRFLGGLLRGDLGYSLLNGQPVSQLIAQQLAPTLALATGALMVAVGFGLLLGIPAALDSSVSSAARLVIGLALGTPVYWTGTIAIYIFTVLLGLLPSSGAGRLSQLLLPVGVLGFHTGGAIARAVQASVRETLEADFVRTARAKGLHEGTVLIRHVLRAALIPVITVTALQAGFLLSGTVITESLFVRPGIGRLLLDSTLRQDYPVVQGIVVLTCVVYALVNATADLLYRLADPRVTH